MFICVLLIGKFRCQFQTTTTRLKKEMKIFIIYLCSKAKTNIRERHDIMEGHNKRTATITKSFFHTLLESLFAVSSFAKICCNVMLRKEETSFRQKKMNSFVDMKQEAYLS